MGEAEKIPLFFTLIPVLALLSNYDRENCLINVGTEGPFGLEHSSRRVVILSGFSGVATCAIARLLTAEDYFAEFLRLDAEYRDLNHDIESLIGVEYKTDREVVVKDSRRIERVWFEQLVDISAEYARAGAEAENG